MSSLGIGSLFGLAPGVAHHLGKQQGGGNSFLDFLFGKDEKIQQTPRFTPQQEGALNQTLRGAQEQLPQLFQYLQQILSQNPEMMRQFEAPAMRQFNEQIIPTIAERFTGLDAQKSSAFGQQLGQAGAGLSENLAAQRANLGSQAANQLQSLLGAGLTPQFENIFRPQTFGFLGQLGSSLGQGLGQLGSMGLGKLFGL
jgi:hypothetical protein